jgi:hypothetical protein
MFLDDFVLDGVGAFVHSYNYITGKDKYQLAKTIVNVATPSIIAAGYFLNSYPPNENIQQHLLWSIGIYAFGRYCCNGIVDEIKKNELKEENSDCLLIENQKLKKVITNMGIGFSLINVFLHPTLYITDHETLGLYFALLVASVDNPKNKKNIVNRTSDWLHAVYTATKAKSVPVSAR